MRTFLRPLAVFLLLAASLTAEAAAQTPDDGLFSVNPARQVINGRPPKALAPFTVSNTTEVALNVKVIPAILDQRVSGEIIFDERDAALRDAKKILAPNVEEFRLEPGARRTVRVRWNLQPRGQDISNMGVVFQGTAATESTAVQTVQRLLTLNFLQLPGRYRSTGRFTLLRALQGEGRTLNFVPRIENTGEIVQSPQDTRVLVRDAKGDAVFDAPFVSDIILPGRERDYPVTMRKILPKGEYRLSASATFGNSGRIVIRSNFTLVGPNRLPSPKVALENLAGRGEIGGDSEATAVVHSVGTATANTNVKIQLFRLTERNQVPKEPLEEKKLPFEGLAPGERRNLRIVYPGLPAGNYRLIATYRDTPDTIARAEADFSPVAPAKDEGSGALLPLLGGLGAFLIGLFLFFLWRRRRKKEDEEELDPTLAGAGAVPAAGAVAASPEPVAASAAPAPAPAAVDLNTASHEDLQQLPGIGPKAASRIVEHREEYGRYSSLDDLRRVEGFDDERIAALSGRVSF